MDIPSLPTDNLYKFQAIIGLIIILISTSSLVIEYKNVQQNIIELERKVALTYFEEELLKDDFNELNRIIDKDFINKYNISLSDTNQIKSKPSILKNKYYLRTLNGHKDLHGLILSFNELSETNKLLKTKSINIKYDQMQINRNILYLFCFKILTGLSSLIGLFLSIFGFKNWYYKCQKIQDQILKKEVG